MTDKTEKQVQADAKLCQRARELLYQAKQYQCPKLKAGNTNSQLEQIGRLLNVELPTVGTTQQHIEGWYKILVDAGVNELTECAPLDAAVCILLMWRDQQQGTSKEQHEVSRLANGDDYNSIRHEREQNKAAAAREKESTE